MIPYEDMLALRTPEREYRWSDREVMLYALGIGMGADPLDRRELDFVFERDLKVVPTFATIAAWGAWPRPDEMRINFQRAVHGEEASILHKALPSAGGAIASGRVKSVTDKGAEKGAVIVTETVLREIDSGEPLATRLATVFARGDGGFGGPSEGGEPPHSMPSRSPDRVLEFATQPNQAAIYRLSGDRNPLHIDPDVALGAGFAKPILQGLCTSGITCRAILEAFADYVPERIASHKVRFSAPVFPGETIAVRMWRDRDVVSFEAEAKERQLTVIKGGKVELRDV